MPFISIIIPTHNNEEHIEQAIISCFDSDFDDFEIIVINDASTDSTVAKLELLADKYKDKIKINHSKSNIGPGPARNIGLEQAKGGYIMFLDGDDWFEPDAVKIVAEKLKKVEPDVLMFNHQRVWENGIKVPNLPNRHVNIDYSELDISHPQNKAELIRNIYVPWNKAYKNSFVKKVEAHFPEGLYEDIYWSISLIIKAEKAHYISNLITNYRQRNGSITRSSSPRHTDLIEQYQIVKKYLISVPEHSENYGRKIYESCRAQIFGAIRVGYRLPKDLEKQFMTSSYKLLRDWKKELKIKDIDPMLISLRLKNKILFTALIKLLLK